MTNTQAIKPSYFSQLPTLTKKPFNSLAQLTEDEKQLATLAKQNGWKILKDFIESVMQDMDTLTENSIAISVDYTDIGQKAVVASLGKGLLRQIIAKVEDAEEALESQNGK